MNEKIFRQRETRGMIVMITFLHTDMARFQKGAKVALCYMALVLR